MRPISFEDAKRQFVHRYTMDHIPAWAAKPNMGRSYAPQYRSDREWYERTRFYGEDTAATLTYCYSSGQTWPLGTRLARAYHGLAPYQSGDDAGLSEADRRDLEISRAVDDCSA